MEWWHEFFPVAVDGGLEAVEKPVPVGTILVGGVCAAKMCDAEFQETLARRNRDIQWEGSPAWIKYDQRLRQIQLWRREAAAKDKQGPAK
jgi:hypothetical protein